jgi:hypothetical protein
LEPLAEFRKEKEDVVTLFYNFLFTAIFAGVIVVMVYATTGSLLATFIAAGATGLFRGLTSARRVVEEDEDGEAE